jgi:hypothetical protein
MLNQEDMEVEKKENVMENLDAAKNGCKRKQRCRGSKKSNGSYKRHKGFEKKEDFMSFKIQNTQEESH